MGEWDAPHLDYLDDKIMPMIDISNIACGGHAGSKVIIKHTLTLAKKYNIKVGAHPSFLDRDRFGRSIIDVDPRLLYENIKNQIDLFLECCEETGIQPFHIKPHGALYHSCNKNKKEAQVLIDIMALYPELTLFVLPESQLYDKAIEANILVMTESFVDRTYTDELNLLDRTKKNSLITDAETASKQFEMLSCGKVSTQSKKVKQIHSMTTCIHGDNPSVISILEEIKSNG